MDKKDQTSLSQPMIVRLSESNRTGIQSQQYVRHGIGMVLRGSKHIYIGDTLFKVERGDLFYLGTGTHYIENVPEEGKAFEQIVFYYTPKQASNILTHLNLDYDLDIHNDHNCSECAEKNYVIISGWPTIREFFQNVSQYMKEGLFESDPKAEKLKITELFYLIVNQSDCCIKSKLLNNSDSVSENFQQIIYKNIFKDKTIDDLAKECNRSLTSFKKEFKRHFYEPPHRWFIKQRLMQARLLLISSDKSISEISLECRFPNTSHFIKLFKKEYGITPANYRAKHIGGKKKEKRVINQA